MTANKRGAIELSISTIVIVVIGITLLTLGLTFVYNIFSDIGEQQKQLGEFTDQKIREIFEESDEPLNLATDTFSIEQGDIFDLEVIIKNTGPLLDQRFTLEVLVNPNNIPSTADENNVKNWFRFSRNDIRLNSGQADKIRIQIRPRRDMAPLGDYLINLKMDSTDAGLSVKYQPISITIT